MRVLSILLGVCGFVLIAQVSLAAACGVPLLIVSFACWLDADGLGMPSRRRVDGGAE